VAADLVYGINPVREALRGERRRPLELLAERDSISRLEALLREAVAGGAGAAAAAAGARSPGGIPITRVWCCG
jgi:hypothetical protein